MKSVFLACGRILVRQVSHEKIKETRAKKAKLQNAFYLTNKEA